MTLKVIRNILITLLHLRPVQIRYQLWYRFRKIWRKAIGFNYPLTVKKQGTPVKLQPWIEKPVSYSESTFTFLNLSKKYQAGSINWNETEYGKLWTYNLNYFDFLLQKDIDKATGIELVENYIKNLNQNSIGLEPYPISLRGINWIKFISSFEDFTLRPLRNTAAPAARNEQVNSPRSLRDSTVLAARKKIDASLYAQYQILLDNLEYHLLGNHLLEDAFSLLFGAFYFNDNELYQTAERLLNKVLKEQILNDGGHFELSPMYHQIILERLLDSINLVQNNYRFDSQKRLLNQMQNKVQKMLKWLNQMTFYNGNMPLFNDAAPGLAPTTQQLNEYAIRLNLVSETSRPTDVVQPLGLARNQWILSESGYRRFNGSNYECIIDIGAIGPSYQPGHAHADTFNFVLNVKNEPLLVDTGISTYEEGITRLKERGTAAHNTVTVQNKNSTEVWSSFRVARRAEVKIIKDEKKHVVAQHDGYRKLYTIHQREWNFEENQIEITDTLTGKFTEGKAHFWFNPAANPRQNYNRITSKRAMFAFENEITVKLIPTEMPSGYNRFVKTHKVEVTFKNHLKTFITVS